MRRKLGIACWGLALLGVGVGLGGAALGWWDYQLFFKGWWTLFLIIPALIMMVHHGINIGNVIMLLVGVLLLLQQQGVLTGEKLGKLILPGILVIVGLGILWRAIFPGKKRAEVSCAASSFQEDATDAPVCTAVFASQSIVNRSQDFRGAKLTAVFGGIEFDMREAIVKEDVVITCTSVFGGIEVIAPKGVRLEMHGMPIFGGNECSAAGIQDQSAPKIILQCTAIFGGNEIK